MTNGPTPSPEDTVAVNDPGDETANRYRYQWTWAAVVCCMLLDDTLDIQEVFCEHHEDVLLKHRDGTFTGHQIKTRNDMQSPWRARDEAVLSACIRFAKLDSEYPGKFRRFCFFTNHPFHTVENAQSFPYVLRSIKDVASVTELPSPVASWLRSVARDANVTEAVAFAALSKAEASADLPKLRDIFMRLISTIVQCWAPAKDCSHDVVNRVAQALVEECGRASSLGHEQLMPVYLIAAGDSEFNVLARIEGKRMTLARVQSVLERGRDSYATLTGDPIYFVEPGEGSTDLLHKKLDAGGFSAVTRNSAEDLRDKADYLGIVWTMKYGRNSGLERYNHIRSVVLSDAGRAFDATQTEADGFGPLMRDDLRRRFHERREAGDQLYDSTDDHLEGVAFSLTAQCMIVWSHARPWEEE